MKIGRNQPCPCGSGKKFKRCHGAVTDNAPAVPAIQQKLDEIQALQLQREQQQGLGRPIITEKVGDCRIVAVGGMIFWSSKWRTFHDFLLQYIKRVLGPTWGNAQKQKPEPDQHPLFALYRQATTYINSRITRRGEVHRAESTGAVAACLDLAYSLYLLAHNERLHSRLLRRLRGPQFFPVFYEALVFAALIRAGFRLEFEDETDPETTHCELVATARHTGKKFSVEVKMRQQGTASEDLGRQLKKALAKRADHPRIVFLEANLPDAGEADRERVADRIAGDLTRRESEQLPSGDGLPPAYVIVTNHPYFYGPDKPMGSIWAMPVGFGLPDFGWGVKFARLRELINARANHVEVWNLIRSFQRHNTIPMTFDGDIPELTFGSGEARFRIGREYRLPDAEGHEIIATLKSAHVFEKSKLMWGIFESRDGRNFVSSCAMTDDEIAGYRRHPETFFGVMQGKDRIDDPLDLYDWFYERYKNATRDNLLNLVAGAADFERFTELPLDQLIEACCERLVEQTFAARPRN